MNKKILFISFRWNDERLMMHSSDKMMSFGFERAGWQVEYYDYRESHRSTQNNEDALDKILRFNPDIVFLNKCERLDPSIINKAKQKGFKGKFVFWHMDIRRPLVRSVVNWSKVSDWVFHCKGGSRLEEYYRATNTPTSFLFAPFEPEYVPSKSDTKRDIRVSWYGQLYDPRKGFDPLRRNIIPNIRGSLDDYGACFDRTFIRGKEYWDRLARSSMSISIPALDQPFYFSNRQSHIMGSGAVVLSYEFKNCFDMFTEGVDIITFKNYEELLNKIDYYLNNTDELENIRHNSKKFANRYLTSDKVYEEIVYVFRTGESSYPFGQVINPDRRKLLDA
jgi:hypothetical protein